MRLINNDEQLDRLILLSGTVQKVCQYDVRSSYAVLHYVGHCVAIQKPKISFKIFHFSSHCSKLLVLLREYCPGKLCFNKITVMEHLQTPREQCLPGLARAIMDSTQTTEIVWYRLKQLYCLKSSRIETVNRLATRCHIPGVMALFAIRKLQPPAVFTKRISLYKDSNAKLDSMILRDTTQEKNRIIRHRKIHIPTAGGLAKSLLFTGRK